MISKREEKDTNRSKKLSKNSKVSMGKSLDTCENRFDTKL